MTIPEWPAGTVAILATGGGAPHAIPVSTAVRAGQRTVLFALAPGRDSLARLRAEPRCALAIVGDDLAVTLYGRAAEIGEAAGTIAVRLDVDEVQDHGRSTFEIESGVRWRWTDPEAERRDREVRAALLALG